MHRLTIGMTMALALVGCCDCQKSSCKAWHVSLTPALADEAWTKSAWIAVPDAPIASDADKKAQIAAPGVSWFVGKVQNAKDVTTAKWMTAGLGVYELYLNRKRVGTTEALKPGFTHVRKTRRSFTYDVTEAFKCGKGEENVLAAEVSAGWWRDQIVGYAGKKSAFRGVLELTYSDGTKALFGTGTNDWTCAIGGPVKRAGIFDGEIYDARIAAPTLGGDSFKTPEISTEFTGEILPTCGAEVYCRRDLALAPIEAYTWKETTGATSNAFGKVVKSQVFDPKGAPLTLAPGETLVVDFGQNCAGVPAFTFIAKPGVTLTCLPGEAMNDANGEHARGNDGPGGSVYRENLRMAKTGMRIDYTFASDGVESYMPRHTFFGYRHVSITATDTVKILKINSFPVTSIAKEMELGKIETGNKDINRLIANVYWGQLSNYLSVPTDCPQRNERQGWTADTQVFTEAGAFNANTYGFFRKFLRDMRDTQPAFGGYTGVAPAGEYGYAGDHRFGWADCGIIAPYVIWRQFGKTEILAEHWASMEKYMTFLADNRYAKGEALAFQWGDWLSYEDYESASGRIHAKDKNGKSTLRPEALLYWKYLGGCYWLMDSRMMAEMASALGKSEDAAKYAKMADEARAYIRKDILVDGDIPECLRGMQTPALFALHSGILDAPVAAKAKERLLANIKAHGDCLQTGFLGTSILMDTLTEIGSADVAYTLLLQHKNPSWLYSVDQGATTIWERWNSYTKANGFGDVGMNSFNHYAYGAVLAWIYKTAAGIAADSHAPGFKSIVMRPIPDRRLGFVKAQYQSAAGLIKSAWRYEGAKWIWEFTIPEGAVARVTLPGEKTETTYKAGTYKIEK